MEQIRPWERSLLGVPLSRAGTLLPGAAAAAFLAWLSVWLSRFIGETLLGFDRTPISAVMLAVLLGLGAGHLVSLPQTFAPGITFTVKKVLRAGIILLGIRLTIFDVFVLGSNGVPIVVLCITGALLFTAWICRVLELPLRLGTLIAVGTAICGVSAIVAIAPAIEAEEEESAYAVAVITIFGLLATILYPFLAEIIFNGDALKAGLFLGTAVHDTSQVVGAAKVYADVFSASLALDVATVTKLVRNVFMVPVIPLLAYMHTRRTRTRDSAGGMEKSFAGLLPLFILGFLAVAAFRSLGDAGIGLGGRAFGFWTAETWPTLIHFVRTAAGNLLVAALAGVGLGTDLRAVRGLGIKPFFAGLAAAAAVGAISVAAVSLLGGEFI